jgi:predicted transcriptional regulator
MLDSMSKSKRRPGPKVKQAHPGPRHQGSDGPTGPAPRVSRLSVPQLLERIERARVTRDKADAELAVLIDQAVSLSIGWPEIAAKLGVTRQAARQHYQRRHRDGASRQDQVAKVAQNADVKHQVEL